MSGIKEDRKKSFQSSQNSNRQKSQREIEKRKVKLTIKYVPK